jgi:hypothetical protein
MLPVIIKSTDAGAPVMTGQVGKLIDVLDFALVSGLGWTKVFSGTNRAAYRAPAGIRDYLDVNDTGPFGATSATVLAFETMSAVGTGTQRFPATTQTSSGNGLGVEKSVTADGTARAWLIIGDDKTFYGIFTGQGAPGPTGIWGFGEFYSYLANDNNRSVISTGKEAADGGGHAGPMGTFGALFSTTISGLATYGKRSYTGLGGAVHIGNMGSGVQIGGGALFVAKGDLPGPDPVDGKYRLNKILMLERGTSTSPVSGPGPVRGHYRGLYQFNHLNTVFTDGDTLDGSLATNYSGKTFILLRIGLSAGMSVAFETTEWESN